MRLFHGQPLSKPTLREGRVFKKSQQHSPKLTESSVVLDLAKRTPKTSCWGTMTRPANPDSVSYKEIRKAHVIIVDSVSDVERLEAGYLVQIIASFRLSGKQLVTSS